MVFHSARKPSDALTKEQLYVLVICVFLAFWIGFFITLATG